MILKRSPLKILHSGIRNLKTPGQAVGFAGLMSSSRLNSTIAISPANTGTSEKKPEQDSIMFEKYISRAENVTSYLNKYKALFRKDVITNSQIDTFEEINNSNQKQVIKIGIIYEDEVVAEESKIIDSILSDPLSSGNESWFSGIVERSRQHNNKFKYGLESELGPHDHGIQEEFKVPSPILNSMYRPSYMKSSDKEISNDIEIWEINDKAQLVDNPKMCHFYINVTRNFTTTIQEYSKLLQNHILLTVVDNTEYSPSSTESTPISIDMTAENNQHIIKINSQLSFHGINQFLKYDTEVSTQYLQSLIHSNIYELSKCIGKFLQTEVLCLWLLSNISSNISKYNITPDAITEVYSSIKSDVIPRFSDSLHSELQNKLVPKTNTYFKRKLRWWKLYLKNDNVEYDLKDFFNENFMGSSIEGYNYVRGKLVSQMQQHEYAQYQNNTEITNPLLKMKNDLVNERLMTEIQPVVYSSIGLAFVYYQLPLSILSFLAYQYFEFTSSSAIAIALLGWVVGFNQVSKQWEKFTYAWLQELYEDVRVCIGRDCIEEGLLKELNSRYNDERNILAIKNEILQGIKDSRHIDV